MLWICAYYVKYYLTKCLPPFAKRCQRSSFCGLLSPSLLPLCTFSEALSSQTDLSATELALLSPWGRTNVMVVVRINTLHWDKLNRDMRPASSRLVGSPHPCVSIKLQSAQSISTILDTTKKWTCIACLGLCSREMSHVIFCHTIKKDCIIAKVQ